MTASAVAAIVNAALTADGKKPLFVPAATFRGPTPERRKQKRTAGSFGRGLRNHFTKLQRGALPRVRLQRDEAGAFTAVGSRDPLTGERRKWLAGISAQRGY